jgi:hypothetical protein
MNIWFVRSNGESAHNNPAEPAHFIPGEPEGETFDYREKCLQEGFARIGWPNTGDLRKPGQGRLAPDSYTLETLPPDCRRYLEGFQSIRAGDLILIPAATGRYTVHLGLVIRRDAATGKEAAWQAGRPAYHFHLPSPPSEKDPYECAHRVDVRWQRINGEFAEHRFADLGGIWLRPFGKVVKARDAVLAAARQTNLR